MERLHSDLCVYVLLLFVYMLSLPSSFPKTFMINLDHEAMRQYSINVWKLSYWHSVPTHLS